MKYITYIGCYTDESRKGIHIFEADADSGDIRPSGSVEGIENATFICLSSKRPLLYVALGLPEYGTRERNGALAVYEIKRDSLAPIGFKPLGLTPPCHVALDPCEKALVFAEYANAIAGICELEHDGSFSAQPAQTARHTGKGPDPERQDKAHAHCAEVTPDGKYLCVADLGIDRTKVYDFQNRERGLVEKPEMAIIAKGGSGPRHIIFHSNGRLAFLLHELDNTVSSFLYNGETFTHVQTLDTLPADFHDFSKASAIKISGDGRLLLTSNRGHDSIASFAIDPVTGKLERIAICKLAGAFPRDFEFMPGEKFILAGHENSNNIMSYAFERATGMLTPAHGPQPLYRPVCIKFGAVKRN